VVAEQGLDSGPLLPPYGQRGPFGSGASGTKEDLWKRAGRGCGRKRIFY